MDRNPQKLNPHTIKQRYCTVLLLSLGTLVPNSRD